MTEPTTTQPAESGQKTPEPKNGQNKPTQDKNGEASKAGTPQVTGKRDDREIVAPKSQPRKQPRLALKQRAPMTKNDLRKMEKKIVDEALTGAVFIRSAHNLQRLHSRYIIHIGFLRYSETLKSLKEKSDGSLPLKIPLIGHIFYTVQRIFGNARKRTSEALKEEPETLSDKISSHVIPTALHSYSKLFDDVMSKSATVHAEEIAKRRAEKSAKTTLSHVDIFHLLKNCPSLQYACTTAPDMIKYAAATLSQTNSDYISQILDNNPVLNCIHRYKTLYYESRSHGKISNSFVAALDMWKKQRDPTKAREFKTPNELRAIQSSKFFADGLQKLYKKEMRELTDKCRSFLFVHLIFPAMMSTRLSAPGWTMTGNPMRPWEGCAEDDTDPNELMTKFFVDHYEVPMTQAVQFKNEDDFVIPLSNDDVAHDWRKATFLVNENIDQHNKKLFGDMVGQLPMLEYDLQFPKYVVEGERSVTKLLHISRENRRVMSSAKLNLVKMALTLCTTISGSPSTACYLASHKEALGAVLSLALALNGIVKDLMGQKRSTIEVCNGGVVDAFYTTVPERAEDDSGNSESSPLRPGYVAGIVGAKKKLPFYDGVCEEGDCWEFLSNMNNYFPWDLLAPASKRYLIPRNSICGEIPLPEVEVLYGPMFDDTVNPITQDSSQQATIEEEFPTDL